MASEQQQRRRVDETFQRENTNSDRDVHVEKGKAHKMTSHFESLADKSKDSGTGGIGLGEGQAGGGGRDTLVGRVAVVEVGVPAEKREMKIGDQGGRTEAKSATEVGAGTHGTTRGVGPEMLHQISGREQKRGGGGMIGAGKGGGTKGAATATGGGEMHGADTVGVGEGKVHHRTEAQISHGQGEKQQQSKGHDTAEKRGGQGQESQLSLEEIAKLRALAQQNSMDSLREMDERYKKATEAAGAASEFAAQKASQAKNTVTQGAQTATQYVAEKAVSAKDTAMEKTQQGYQAAKEYTVPKAAQAKDYTAQKAVETKDYTAQKALEAKNKAAEVTKNMAGYAGEKAVVAKDTAVEKSKVAADYTGKVASDVKDKAVVAGWGAAHYTTEKTVEGTKMVARAVEGVAGKVGEVVAGAGHVAADLAKKSLSAVKDTAISTEETVAEYMARKREEAERQLKAKNPDTEESRGLTQGTTGIGAGDTIGTAKAAAGAIGDILGGPPEQENLFSPATELVHEGAKLASDTVQGTAAAARDTVGGIFQRKQGGGVVQSGTQAAEDTARAATDTALGTARVAKDTVKGTAAAAATGPLGGVYQELKSGAQAAKDTVGTAGATTETVRSAVSATGAAMDTVSEKLLGSEQQGGVLGAIGETIVEIAQTTKNIVVGPAEIQTEANTEYNDVTDSIKKTEVTRQRLQKRQ